MYTDKINIRSPLNEKQTATYANAFLKKMNKKSTQNIVEVSKPAHAVQTLAFSVSHWGSFCERFNPVSFHFHICKMRIVSLPPRVVKLYKST